MTAEAGFVKRGPHKLHYEAGIFTCVDCRWWIREDDGRTRWWDRDREDDEHHYDALVFMKETLHQGMASKAVWEELSGRRILDPDGWRPPYQLDFETPICYGEWCWRSAMSTQLHLDRMAERPFSV